MFVTPFSAPLPETLASHVFGRFLPHRAPVAAAPAPTAPVVSAIAVEEDYFDLAQRVREIGEW